MEEMDMGCVMCVPGRYWNLPFLAEAEAVAPLRRFLQSHLELWGLHEAIETVQLLVTELVANVINHVGPGTPTTLALSLHGTDLRIEVHDPDTRALPTLVDRGTDSESGRGMTLVDAMADRWGVQLLPDSKVTWCELTQLSHRASVLSRIRAEEAVVGAIANILHWLRAHGGDPDEVLDRAQTHFEVQIADTGGRRG